jgi:hypothetical protein
MKPGIKTIIAGVVCCVGAFIVPVLFVLPLILADSPAVQFKVPGTMEVTVKDAGRYYLWNDYQTVFNGKSYNRSESLPDGYEIQIREEDGRLFQFVSDASTSESNGASAKKSIGYVEVEHPGKLEIEVTGGNEDRIMSFARSGLLKVFGLILGGVGLSMLIGMAGIGLIIWGIIKLVRSNKTEPRPPPGGLRQL